MHSEISITQSKEGKEDNEFCDKIGPDLPADIWDWFLHDEPDVSQHQDQDQEESEDEPSHHSSRTCRADWCHLHPGIWEPLGSSAFNIQSNININVSPSSLSLTWGDGVFPALRRNRKSFLWI